MKRKLPKGVYYNRNSYRAFINISGIRIDLGTYPTIEEASSVYKESRARNPDARRLAYSAPRFDKKGKELPLNPLHSITLPRTDPHYPSLSTLWN
jgi:hypothetical protein